MFSIIDLNQLSLRMPGRNYFVAPLNRPDAVYFSLSTMIIHLLRENYQVDPKAQSGLIQLSIINHFIQIENNSHNQKPCILTVTDNRDLSS